MSLIRGTCIGLALALILSPVCQAGMSATAPVETGKFLNGCCNAGCVKAIGRLSSSSGVEDAFEWFGDTISDQLEDIGESDNSGTKKVIAAMNKRFEPQNAKIRQLVTAYGTADENFRNTLDFGKRSKAFLVPERSAYLTGKAGNAEFSRTLNKRMNEYSRSFPQKSDIAQRLSGTEESAINSQGFFPGEATLQKDRLKNLVMSLKTTSNAFPATNATSLPDSEKQAHRSIKRAKRIRVAAATSALSEVMSGYAPTIPVQDKMKKLASRTGSITGIENGRMSPVSYLELLVRSRFGNDEYRTGKAGIHTMTRTGVLRELVSVQALRLAIERRQLRRARQMAFLEAMKASGMTVGDSLDLWSLYRKATRH